MTETAHILVVDDEADVREMLAEYLAPRGFAVATAADAAACRLHLERQPVDLVLLDVTMPGEDGLSLARHIRASGGIGIIMLTAAGTTVDRIVGLEIGADDYIAKPFDPREVLARIRSVLRRIAETPAKPGQAVAPTAPRTVRIGRCLLDLDARTLSTLAGEDVPITAMEFDLLKAFAERPNRVLTRDQLLDLAHNRDWEPFDRSIDIRVTRIRRKIETNPQKPEVIKTVRGAGYMFVPHPKS
jgi:two-component system phosphate regulon response regulator OmpR